MRTIRSGVRWVPVGVLLGLIRPPWVAAAQPPPFHVAPQALYSTVYANPDTLERVETIGTLRADKAPWMRLRFSDWNLGRASYIILTSEKDGGWQRLDSRSLAEWNGTSAVFNGDRVKMDLHVAPGDENVSVGVRELIIGEWVGGSGTSAETLCGNDDRVASTDNRVGRLFAEGCTAWLVSNGAVLTAGHCTDLDPDRSGPLLPDGILDLAGPFELNVPASQADGTIVAANPNDQYPVNTSRVTWRFDGEGQGLGKDWSVFAVNPNSNTRQIPHIAGGFFRMTREIPSNGVTVRITGFGTDNTPVGSTNGFNAQNQTNQTSTGAYNGETASGADIRHRYAVDSEGGNSGSPIIWEANGFTIGIHTNGGCTSTGGENIGTSFEVDALETALQNFQGTNTFYVDIAAVTNTFNGTIFSPFNNVSDAVFWVPAGGTVSMVRGSYVKEAGNTFAGNRRITKAMRLVAPVGAVRIGD